MLKCKIERRIFLFDGIIFVSLTKYITKHKKIVSNEESIYLFIYNHHNTEF